MRETESLVRKLKTPKSIPEKVYKPNYIEQVVSELQKLLNTPVSANSNAQGRGQLKINFESQEKLQNILNKIKGED